MTQVVGAAIDAFAPAIQPPIDALSPVVETAVDPIALAVEAGIDPVTLAVEVGRQRVPAGGLGSLRPPIQTCVDPVAPAIEALVDAITPAVESGFDPVTPPVESRLDPVAPVGERALASLLGRGGAGRQAQDYGCCDRGPMKSGHCLIPLFSGLGWPLAPVKPARPSPVAPLLGRDRSRAGESGSWDAICRCASDRQRGRSPAGLRS